VFLLNSIGVNSQGGLIANHINRKLSQRLSLNKALSKSISKVSQDMVSLISFKPKTGINPKGIFFIIRLYRGLKMFSFSSNLDFSIFVFKCTKRLEF